jgi:hypothetical protein
VSVHHFPAPARTRESPVRSRRAGRRRGRSDDRRGNRRSGPGCGGRNGERGGPGTSLNHLAGRAIRIISGRMDSFPPSPAPLRARRPDRLDRDRGSVGAASVPARRTAPGTLTGDAPEREMSDRVNEAYGLTPEEIGLMWQTAPPRMPIARP